MSSKYTKIKRHEIKCMVEQEYGITVKSMHEGEHGILFCTDKGTKLLKKLKCEDGGLLFTASACDYIYSRGFAGVGRLEKTISDRYYISYNEGFYMLQDFVKGRLFTVLSPEDAATAARTLAALHKAGEGFIPVPGSRARVDWGKWMEKFKSYAANIKKYKEIAEQRKNQTKFDRLFLKYADMYYERMYKAYLLLKENDYLGRVQQSMHSNQLTHKEYRKHSLYIQEDGELFVSNMENCSYDIKEVDLADLLESFSGKNKNAMACAALDAYRAAGGIDRGSIPIIEAFLLQPKRFYKVIEKYYGKKKNYTEYELCSKLERSIRHECRKDEIISFLESYYIIWPPKCGD